mmetsp:Transcript_15614/g.26030  ORF Transcript_15614/g.26030 Transcript_15614/m.26030 type:complete len:218 (-) Transcript_15614:79-732(-)
MKAKLTDAYGTMQDGTVWADREGEGENRRPKGFTTLGLFATLLDPRTKSLRGVGPIDKEAIIAGLTQYAVQQLQNVEPAADQNVPNVVAPDDFYDNIFLDQAAVHNEADNGILQNNNLEDTIAAELLLYNQEQQMPRRVLLPNGNYEHSNPLNWWRVNQFRYPNLAVIARRVLAIPATSAPVERLFSVAGLTIANDRARLLPELAEDLIFIHEAFDL